MASDYPTRLFRFEVLYSFWNYNLGQRLMLKLVTGLNQWILSINNFFSSSIWFEREIWDLFGIKFLLHGDLRRLLTDYGFRGHPLRKDFPLIGYFEARYDDILKGIFTEPVEMAQVYRRYKFINPWAKLNLF
jgi:NADH:ubiquinone oxidoreductase subunit C